MCVCVHFAASRVLREGNGRGEILRPQRSDEEGSYSIYVFTSQMFFENCSVADLAGHIIEIMDYQCFCLKTDTIIC